MCDPKAESKKFLIGFINIRVEERCNIIPELTLGVVTQRARKREVLRVQALRGKPRLRLNVLHVTKVNVRDFRFAVNALSVSFGY
jgi:hypothetical protein